MTPTTLDIALQTGLQWGGHHGPHAGPAGGMGQWGGFGLGPYGLWPLFTVVLVAGVIAVGLLLLWERRPDTGDPALRTLRERYARGEMTDEEFENRAERLAGRRERGYEGG